MVETVSSTLIALALIGSAFFTAQKGNVAMTVFSCAMLSQYMILWKLDYIERRVKRLCELLEGEGDDGED